MSSLQSIIERHRNPVLFLSAGKDSLACLLLLQPLWDRLTVAWANPGAPHPEVVAYMARIRALVPRFVELKGSQPDWVRSRGWPVDVVPARRTVAGELGAGPAPVRFQSFMECCGANMWNPMHRYVSDSGADMVITGQRRSEGMRNRMRDELVQVIEGVTYLQPVNEWSEAEVRDFIHTSGWALPPFYEHGAESSADCWNCTAYLDHNRGRLAHLRRTQPEKFAVVETVLGALADELRRETAPLHDILEGAAHG